MENDFNSNEKKGMFGNLTGKQKIFIGGGAVFVVLLILLLLVRTCSVRFGNSERNNTVALVKTYIERGEYDRALDKLDEILIKNRNDKEALELLDRILSLKDGSEPSSERTSGSNVDAENLTEVMKSSLDSMKDEMAKNSKAAEGSRKVMEDLVRQQQKQQEQQLMRQKIEDEKRTIEEAERKAEQKAQEERRKAEEAKRKADEEALAKKNAQLKKEILAVNDDIQQGKAALNSGNIKAALSHFMDAEKLLPVSDGEPNFSASKYSEIASLMQAASEKAASQEEKKLLQEKALEYANKAVEKDSKNPVANYILGQDAMAKKDYQKAAEYFTKAISGDNKNHEYYYNLGRSQYMLKKYAEAKAAFSSAAQQNSSFAPARYNLGLTNLKLNDKKAAKAEFIKAHDIDPRYEKAYLEEGRVLVQLGEYQNAIAAYQKVVSLNNVNRAALQELGSVYFQTGNYPLAEESFRKSLALLPSGQRDPLTNYNLSTVLFEQKKTDDALSYAKKAYDSSDSIKDRNARVNIVYNYALLCEKTGKTSDAIARYAEVLTLNPNHLKTQINLGVMYMNLNPPDIDTALSLFKKAFSQDSKNFEANNNLGSAYLSKKDYPNAILYFQNALQLEPKNNDVRYNLAQAFASDKQFDNAKTTYTELLRQDAKYWDGYIELGKVCMALNDNHMAEAYFEQVKAKNPGYRTSEIDALLSQIR